jgi:hypothetical protein
MDTRKKESKRRQSGHMRNPTMNQDLIYALRGILFCLSCGRSDIAPSNADANIDSHREEFLRDGDQLAARMTGTIKVDGADTFFESFMFGKVDSETGKFQYLIERSIWGPVGKDAEHGVN